MHCHFLFTILKILWPLLTLLNLLLYSWTIKKTEHQRIDAFEHLCWRRLLRVPWTARRSNQSILKEISPGCSLEGLRLKLKLQYFGYLMRRTDSFEKILNLRKIEGKRRRGQQSMRWLDGITDWVDMSFNSSGSWWWTGKSVGLQGVRHNWATELNCWNLVCMCSISRKHGHQHIYLQHGVMNILSPLLRFIAQKIFQNISFHWQYT